MHCILNETFSFRSVLTHLISFQLKLFLNSCTDILLNFISSADRSKQPAAKTVKEAMAQDQTLEKTPQSFNCDICFDITLTSP